MTSTHSAINEPHADLPPPGPRWRGFLPSWLRALIWVAEATSFGAFLSYGWAADRDIAPIIQSVLQSFLCPWYKKRARNIFRDLSCLPAGSDIREELRRRLDRSRHLILLANPHARESRGERPSSPGRREHARRAMGGLDNGPGPSSLFNFSSIHRRALAIRTKRRSPSGGEPR